MPRRLRLHVPGCTYHVILRGNNRQALFLCEADYRRWMRLLALGIDKYQCKLHAYCWMTNHVHMAVQVSECPLGRMIGWVASQYARRTNRIQQRTGHLFERRYRCYLLDTDEYLLQVIRYLHLNPVAAHIVDRPEQYPWSSHRAYLGFPGPSFLTTNWVLRMFGSDTQRAVAEYARFVAEERDKPDSDASSEHERLACEVESAITQPSLPAAAAGLSALIAEICRKRGITEAELASPSRLRRNSKLRVEIALAAMRRGSATLHEVADRFNRSDSALAHAIRLYSDTKRQSGK